MGYEKETCRHKLIEKKKEFQKEIDLIDSILEHL